MWEAGKNKGKKIKDVNAEALKLQGELPEDVAKLTLAEFMYHNPGFFLETLTKRKLILREFQEIILKGWMRNDFSMFIAGRGLGKSWLCAVFCLLWALYNPNNRIVIISFAFRATRRILEQIEKFVNQEDAVMLRACFNEGLKKRNDEWKWVLPNGSSILCVPLGDGTLVRGIRADTVVIDERNYVNNNILTEVVRPFLVSSNKMNDQMRIDEVQNELIASGKWKEEDRIFLEENTKVISLSSAGFQFEDMYKDYKSQIDKILGLNIKIEDETKKEDEVDDSHIRYFVSRMSYEAAPPGFVNKKIIEDAQNGQTSESVFNREYRAIFTPDSGGYFSAKKMQECTIENGTAPCVELFGDKGAEYILAIDPSFSSADYSDFFAMVVLKLVDKNGRKIPLVVHSYMVAGGNMRDHHLYFMWILKNFNIVWVAIDSSQGDNEFISSANNSKLFKDAKIELMDIEADFKKDINEDLPKEIRRSHNKTAYRIVQKQPFTSAFQRSANEYLQASFDYKNIYFASKLASNSVEADNYMDLDISPLTNNHPYFKDVSIFDYIEDQDRLIDLIKTQCALIELKSSALGGQSWDLPDTFRRSKSPDRMRRDGYSALLLGNYAVKLYAESLKVEEDSVPTTFNFFFAR
jgi:hypothetical protein